MTTYIALLRGVNVGGHAVLLMEELKTLVMNLGFNKVLTYIQSGNVLLESNLPENKIVEALEAELHKKLQKQISVILRKSVEMELVLAGNPFPNTNSSLIGVLFFKNPLIKDFFNDFEYSGPEEIVKSNKELYIHYPNGMGRSKLKLPKTVLQGTMRNLNTIRKLAELSKIGKD